MNNEACSKRCLKWVVDSACHELMKNALYLGTTIPLFTQKRLLLINIVSYKTSYPYCNSHVWYESFLHFWNSWSFNILIFKIIHIFAVYCNWMFNEIFKDINFVIFNKFFFTINLFSFFDISSFMLLHVQWNFQETWSLEWNIFQAITDVVTFKNCNLTVNSQL